MNEMKMIRKIGGLILIAVGLAVLLVSAVRGDLLLASPAALLFLGIALLLAPSHVARIRQVLDRYQRAKSPQTTAEKRVLAVGNLLMLCGAIVAVWGYINVREFLGWVWTIAIFLVVIGYTVRTLGMHVMRVRRNKTPPRSS